MMWACYKACVKEFFGDQLGWRGILCMVACLILGVVSASFSGPGGVAVAAACIGITVGASVITGLVACLAMCK